jgi:hypothetical protein
MSFQQPRSTNRNSSEAAMDQKRTCGGRGAPQRTLTDGLASPAASNCSRMRMHHMDEARWHRRSKRRILRLRSSSSKAARNRPQLPCPAQILTCPRVRLRTHYLLPGRATGRVASLSSPMSSTSGSSLSSSSS